MWKKTALIISYDESGGFFDYVPPAVAPPGTPGEHVTVPLDTVTDAQGIGGPIGLGFRLPCLVISPHTRGGPLASETFDHTLQLRLIEHRFNVPVPNMSAWRRETVGDLTSAFDFARAPIDARPQMPDAVDGGLRALIEGNINILLGTVKHAPPYPVPDNAMPRQETTPSRDRPRGAASV